MRRSPATVKRSGEAAGAGETIGHLLEREDQQLTQVLNLWSAEEAAVCVLADGDHVVVVGGNRCRYAFRRVSPPARRSRARSMTRRDSASSLAMNRTMKTDLGLDKTHL
jgi:hypothetical protein